MSEFVKVADTDELISGSCKTVEVSGSRIALFNVAARFYAMDDTCAHRGGPLGDGALDGARAFFAVALQRSETKRGQLPLPAGERIGVTTSDSDLMGVCEKFG